MKYLHTMIRVTDLKRSLSFYQDGLGFTLVSQSDFEKDRFTLAFLRAPGDHDDVSSQAPEKGSAPLIELTHNWDTKEYTLGNSYGHTAYEVSSIEEIQKKLKKAGYDLSWGPGTTPSGNRKMAFVDDPDGYEIELLEDLS